MEGNGNAAQYWLNLSANAYAGMLQLIPLTFVTIISEVYMKDLLLEV